MHQDLFLHRHGSRLTANKSEDHITPGPQRGDLLPPVGDVGKDQPRHEKAIPMGPCIEGWKLSIVALKKLWEELTNIYDIQFLLTNRLDLFLNRPLYIICPREDDPFIFIQAIAETVM